MSTQSSKTSDEARIRALIEDWADAVRDKDVERVVSYYAQDIVTFDLAPPLEHAGAAALRRSLEAWLSTFRGPVGWEVRDLSITTGDDVAFCHSLNRISGTRTDARRRTCGCARPSACGRLVASGRSRTSIRLCPFTWTVATGRQSTSSRSFVWTRMCSDAWRCVGPACLPS